MILIVYGYDSPKETYGRDGRAGNEEDLQAEGADVGDEAAMRKTSVQTYFGMRV